MGLDKTILFSSARAPSWPTIAERLVALGLPCQLRMIDGELAFPDETPREDWRELRLSIPHGMVTLRRETDGMRLVIWGNADVGLLEDRDRIAAVIGALSDGTVHD